MSLWEPPKCPNCGKTVEETWTECPHCKAPLISDNLKLEDGEKIILKEENIGFRSKLLLTNKRLIGLKGKGIFNVTFHPEFSIPIERIEEAYSEVDGISGLSQMKLKQKDGIILDFIFKLRDTDLVLGTQHSVDVKRLATTDRWVYAINNLILERKKPSVVIDFSFLKTFIEKGGIVLTTLKCPHCSAPIKMPKNGTETVCDYCGSTIYAQDVFEKVKTLIG